MIKTLVFANQKGGVGKTTSATNVAAFLAKSGKRVLMIDADPQGNATSGLGIAKSKIKTTTYDIIIGRAEAKDAIIVTKFKNLSVIPATIDLAGAELELYDMEQDENFTKRCGSKEFDAPEKQVLERMAA